MAPENEKHLGFKVSGEMAEWIGRSLIDLDCTLSRFVTACILIGTPLLLQNPSLLEAIRFEGIQERERVRLQGNEMDHSN
jgi:hypothetical protein